MPTDFESRQNEAKDVYDHEWSAAELPSRTERHRHKKKQSNEEQAAGGQSEESEFRGGTSRLPLVRIWLILFLFIIGVVLSYPVWSEI
ncbi:hypothetical protein [Salisediminibacterium halotolerans]|uniref:Uncharacterized protein n=1 Tax=Salisediminibacterium halotolerans TaxID=517425 RepID=A0A1H9P623_9BACI|nr:MULTISPECIES: hypothetical protein [Salisediminibacterium]RLJ77974.1 hypothetical protein BCL39_0438 [Actinophytocola xinjiangensis]RPE88688.1 hypothetical protein EDD67_1021 [Salisediminibacterium halotolerans]TWG36951.1 hypothetical protein BCL52_0437 [Salisediminibacterium halotolerans]SER43640.1 hypothetical protein SAMN05444126_10196 [Salisediminibacterium haloalkalitolerans]GEL08436.1 hypothetical protein SHA02_18520 [Salisediminibacterium halotolerans]